MKGCEEMKERTKKLFCLEVWVKLTPVPTGTHKPMKTLKELAKGRQDQPSPLQPFSSSTDTLILRKKEEHLYPTRLPHQGMRQDKMTGLHSPLTHHRFK